MTGPRLEADIGIIRPGGFSVDVEMAIEPGATVALLGPNGAGKSTVVQALAGLAPLDRGRVVLGDTVLDEAASGGFVAPEERNLGVVFQDFILFPHLSVVENVGFGLRSRGVSGPDLQARVSGLLDRLGLSDLARRRPSDLSGGERQRTALARALAVDPEMLLLDEPLAALDATTRVEVRRLLREVLAGFAGPRLLITHDPGEAFLLADYVYVMEGGRITQSGTPSDIRLRPRTRYAADLAGVNLMVGEASGGTVLVDGHGLSVADAGARGTVIVVIHPRAIALHARQPEGSPRNTWQTSIRLEEDLGERVRLETGPPLPLTVEVTPAAVSALSLAPGSEVWLSIKATEIAVEPA